MNEVFDLTEGNIDHQKLYNFQLKKRRDYFVHKPQSKKIRVTFTTEQNASYDCIYHYKTKEQVYDMIRNEQALDLQYTYIKDFDISKIGDPVQYRLKDLKASNSFWDGYLCFNGIRFIDGDVNFHNAQFGDGDVSFDYTQFKVSQVSFVSAQFGDGQVSFVGAKFSDVEICFDHAKFGNGEICFDSAAFINGYISFILVFFGNGEVCFDCTQFVNNNVSFYNARFGEGDVRFQGARFGDNNVVFENAQFNVGEVNFKYAQFGNGDISFLDSSAQRLVFYKNTFTSHVDLRFDHIDKLIVQDCIIEKTFNCKCPIRFKSLSFLNTINLGQIFIEWDINGILKAVINGTKLELLDENVTPFTSEENASQFRMLKENFHNIGYYDDEDKAYKAYMYYKTKNIKGFLEVYKQETEKGIGKRIYLCFCCFLRKFGYKLFGLIGGYGTRPVQLLGISFTFTLFMGFIFSLFSKESILINKLIDGFYFSAITFLTIGYGYSVNEHWLVKILVSFEGFMGLFLMAYFTVSVVRKILR